VDWQAAATALDSAERDRLPIDLVATAAGAARLGQPAEAVAPLANALGARSRKLEAGWIVLAGGLTEAQPLQPGTQLDATFARLGRVGLRAIALPEVRMSWDQSL
jgi:2-keto-4-pentenoate hydratase